MWAQYVRFRNFKISIFSIVIVLLGTFTTLFWLFWDIIYNVIVINNLILGILIYPIKIAILAAMSLFLYQRWFKQEAIYMTDAYFCFGSFFGIWVFGKIFDVLLNLLWLSGSFDNLRLLLMKIRYTVIIINILPILYIGLEALLVFIELRSKGKKTKSEANKIRYSFIGGYVIILLVLIWIANSVNLLVNLLPIATFIIYLLLMIMFFFMYRNKRLSQANSLIIGIAFLLLILSNIVRAVFTASYESWSIILSEIIDTIIIGVLFTGFITKPKYAKQ
ncbi:MAG: hypothetical protein ACFFFB_00610 [Candidatus Heimdallarchaeota archaeon]